MLKSLSRAIRRSPRFPAIAFLAAAGALAWAAPASARYPEPDTLFLARQTGELDRLGREALDASTTPRSALDAIQRILVARGEALGELAQLHPLTQFDGIETQDRYDEKVVLALLPIARAGVEADSTLPAEEDAVAFNAAMGKLPPLGPNPVGFMVLSVVQGSLAAADSLRRLPDYPAGSADKLALRLIRHLTSDFAAAREDFIRQAKVDAFRQSSVIMRLRCPRDGSPYKVSDMKNNLSDSGQVSTIYFLNCTGCDSPESLHFRLEVASRLNQASEKQPLKQQPQPKRPNPGLEP